MFNKFRARDNSIDNYTLQTISKLVFKPVQWWTSNCIVLYCIFVLLAENIADRTQQMEQANLTKVHSRWAWVSPVN